MINEEIIDNANTGGLQKDTNNPAILQIIQMHTSRMCKTSGGILTNQNARYQKLPQSDVQDNSEWVELAESQINMNGEDLLKPVDLKRDKCNQIHAAGDTRYPKYCKLIEFLIVVIIISVVSFLLIRLLRRPWIEALERK